MTAHDTTFYDAVARVYLAHRPQDADLLAELAAQGPDEVRSYLRIWLGTFEAHRLMVADQLERAGEVEYARWLRDHPLGTW